MQGAGAHAILAEIGTWKMWPGFDPVELAVAVYEAMKPLTPKPTSALTLKLDTSELEAKLTGFIASVSEFKEAVEAATAENHEINRG